MRRAICVLGRPFSGWVWVDATRLAEAAHIVSEILHADLGLRPHQADGAHQGAAHVVGQRAEDVLNPDPHGGFGAVAALGLVGQRLALIALAVDVAFQF